ncbi:MAG: Wzz/FepE/Etk N-terminal domain-containing protein [Devosia sp.]
MNLSPPAKSETFTIDAPVDRQSGQEEDGGFDIRKLITLVWRGKWVIAVSMFVGLCLAIVSVAALQDQYTATATVLYTPDSRNVVDIQDVVNASESYDALGTEIQILSSSLILTQVVESLKLYETAFFNPALKTEPTTMDTIRAWLSWRNWIPWEMLRNIGLVAPPSPPELLSEEERQARLVRRARTILSDNMDLQPIPNTRVIAISFTSDRGNTSARVVNGIARQYITAQLEAKLAATREATLWLTDRVEELRIEVQDADEAVTAYQTELEEATGRSTIRLTQQLEVLNNALSVATAERSALGIRVRRAEEELQDTGRILLLSDFRQSETIERYRTQEIEVLADRAALEELVDPGHERLRALDGRLAHIRENIRTEAGRVVETLRNEYEIAKSKEEEIRSEILNLQRELQTQDAAEVQLRQLQREADASKLIYQSFLGRLKETTQQSKLEEADAVILSPAEPPRSADAQRGNRIIMLGGALGMMAGFGLVFLMDRLNNTFRSIEQAQDVTGIPVLGTVPLLGVGRADGPDVVRHALESSTSSLAESIRKLRTSILFSNIDDPPRTLMFVSSVPAEGKSTTSLLVALMSAQIGKSVVIVDCDLRRPMLRSLMGEDADPSASLLSVLDGTVPIENAFGEDPETGLHYIAGASDEAIPMNAADILSSVRFREFVKELRESYDLVVLDLPPVLSVADATIVADVSDAILYCVQWDDTPRGAVLEGLREFSTVDTAVSGLVLTMVNEKRATSYGYSSYGYGYYRNSYTSHYIDD